MSELKVPKKRVEVELTMVGVGMRRVAMFLAEFASHHEGAEVVSDLLNGDYDFVPAVDVETGRPVVIHRKAVVLARVPKEHERSAVDEEGAFHREVTVTLEDGQTVTGRLSYVMPPESARPVDFLNEAAPEFFPLKTGEQIVLVGKGRIVRVELTGRE